MTYLNMYTYKTPIDCMICSNQIQKKYSNDNLHKNLSPMELVLCIIFKNGYRYWWSDKSSLFISQKNILWKI